MWIWITVYRCHQFYRTLELISFCFIEHDRIWPFRSIFHDISPISRFASVISNFVPYPYSLITTDLYSYIDTLFHIIVHPCARMNFWGYSTINFFSPMARYSSSGIRDSGCGAINEFKAFVREAHKRGIEVTKPI